jgi:methyl-accepting chemotaxis protein
MRSWEQMRLNITAKIWLSIGVFVFGFVIATVLGRMQGVETERTLALASDALFPAALSGQEASASFQRMAKGFGDAVTMQDMAAFEKAALEGRSSAEGLDKVAAINGLSPERGQEARKLAGVVRQFGADARQTYGAMIENPAAMNPKKLKELADRTAEVEAALESAKVKFSGDVRAQLGALEDRSVQERRLALVVFGVTLILAAGIVNLTIRKAITGPIVRVIEGVQNAATAAAAASERVAALGRSVADDAQNQAVCIEETSASLEQISATTRESANRARSADTLMREATGRVGRATESMNDLTASMDAICQSSRQVAGVLKSIDDIAFHTNILALNAAVEAARAGAAGAGFSVVADEVRFLAQRASEAARRSADIIEKTIAGVNVGVKQAMLAHDAFAAVSVSIGSGCEMVAQIAVSNEDQARAVGFISETISRVESLTRHNLTNAQQTAEAAGDMGRQVDTTRHHLDGLVAIIGLRR